MGEKKIDTSFLDKAISFAVKAHSGVERRGKAFPYIVHPMEAMAIVATYTNDQEMLAAAALHDVVEDTEYTEDDIRKEFGDRVAKLVASESDIVVGNKSESESWAERKKFAIDRLKKLDRDGKIVAIGDKLSNARAMLQDYESIGEELWNKFHVTDPKLHKWHYEGLRDSLDELKGSFAYEEFSEIINKLFAKY
ncbi:MAG: HD domain-containing protein [Lachnospiraceae bacterium]|nr:HD domain-containing protein [Lachnospiraceae bacterium]